MKDSAKAKGQIQWNRIFAYLILLLLSLVAFGFGGSSFMNVYLMIGFLFALSIFVFSDRKIDKAKAHELLGFCIPLIVVAVFGSVSYFWLSYSGNSVSGDLISMFGVISFFALGYGIYRCKDIKISYVIFAILGGMALMVLISTVYSLSRYGFFYVTKYAGDTYFYDGVYYGIATETQILQGFSFARVTLNYASVYPFVLAATLFALLYISPKRNPLLFCLVLIEGSIGLLTFVLLGNFKPLPFLIPVAIVALWIKFVKYNPNHEKANRIVGWSVFGLFAALLLIMFVNAIGGTNFFANSVFLNKIFNNGRLTMKINQIINLMANDYSTGSFSLVTFLFGASSAGKTAWGTLYSNPVGLVSIGPNMIEFIMLYEGGFLAFAGLCAFMLFMIWAIRRWLHEDASVSGEKAIIVLFLLAWIVYMSFRSSVFPYVFSTNEYVSPFRRNGLFYLSLLFCGYAYRPIWNRAKAVGIATVRPVKQNKKEGNGDEISL
jgi:hypothetical protein